MGLLLETAGAIHFILKVVFLLISIAATPSSMAVNAGSARKVSVGRISRLLVVGVREL